MHVNLFWPNVNGIDNGAISVPEFDLVENGDMLKGNQHVLSI